MKAMLCVGKCKALRGRMQSFAWADAKLCESGCKALRLRWAKLARKFSVLFWIRVNGGKTHLSATVVPRKFLQNSLNVGLSKKVWSLYRAKTPQANSPNPLWGILRTDFFLSSSDYLATTGIMLARGRNIYSKKKSNM